MKLNKIVLFFIYITLLPFNIWAESEKCLVWGQFIVVRNGDDGYRVLKCQNSVLGVLAAGGFHSKELLEILEKNKNDEDFIKGLKMVGIGDNYTSIRKAIEDFGGMLALDGGRNDIETLLYLANKINETTGTKQKIEDYKKAEAEKVSSDNKRDATPISINPESLELAALNNSKFKTHFEKKGVKILKIEINHCRLLKFISLMEKKIYLYLIKLKEFPAMKLKSLCKQVI